MVLNGIESRLGRYFEIDQALAASAPESRENLPLAGKVFLLTGASRGIGAATAFELARRGAVVIGPHRDPGKNSRALEVVRQVEAVGGRMIAPVADVTKPEDRARLIADIRRDFGKIDGIIFNHAGGMERDLQATDQQYHLKVNGYSKLELFQEAELAGVLKREAILIDIPSLWSTFRHTGIEQLPQYDSVAEGKKLGEQLLREATREYNEFNGPEGKQVKFGSVCGHAIGDTTTVRLLARMNRDAIAAVTQTAEGGKLPTIADMALAIAGMAEGKFDNEDIMFVGPPQIRKDQMPGILDMYNDETRYADSMVFPDRRKIFGFHVTRPEEVVYHFSRRNGALEHAGSGRAFLTVTKNHTLGHFNPSRPELAISIFPGHKQVAGAVEVAQLHLGDKAPYLYDTRLRAIDGPIQFLVPVLPADRLAFAVTNPDRVLKDGSDVSIRIGQVETANIKGLRFEERAAGIPDGVDLDRLIEAAAQTLGVAFLHRNDIRGVLPLFKGVLGGVEYIKPVVPGQKLEMEAILGDGLGKGFTGDVIMRVDDEIVAKVLGIDCRLFPARNFIRLINMARSVLR